MVDVETVFQEALETAEKAAVFLHAHPETGFSEHTATSLIISEMDKLSIPRISLGMDTGAVGFLNAQAPGVVMLRADIDAVPTGDGAAHLCGHDYHTAALLGAMFFLAHFRENLPCSIAFVFQPAEEDTVGASAMVSRGLFEKMPQKPGCIFGIHNRPELPCGDIAVHGGPLMAEKDEFTVTFLGKTGHAGEPEHCIDPILAGAHFTTAVPSLISREISPMERAVCGIFGFRSGNAENNPPEEAVLSGTLRSLSHDAQQYLHYRLEELAGDIAETYRCRHRFHWTLHVPLLDNAVSLEKQARTAAVAAVGEKHVVDTLPSLGSDDFAVFGQEIPAFYFWVGSGEKGKPNACWHEKDFRIAPGYLRCAVSLLIHCVLPDMPPFSGLSPFPGKAM